MLADVTLLPTLVAMLVQYLLFLPTQPCDACLSSIDTL